MSTRGKNAKPVRFADGEDDFAGTQDAGDDNVMEMLSIMKEFQKMKAMKSTSRANALQVKKSALLKSARKDADTLLTAGNAYFKSVRAKVDELHAQEANHDGILKDVVSLWSTHEESMHSLLSAYPSLIEELSPRRARDMNAASEMLETHPNARETSRRRLMSTAKKNLEAGLEAQKLATDASALIKHYKNLLLV